MQPMGENGGKMLVANCAVDVALAVRSEWARAPWRCAGRIIAAGLICCEFDSGVALGQPGNNCLL